MYNISFDISGQVAAITGAGGIICGTMARELAKKGVKVALLDLFVENAQKIADEINANGGEAIAVKANVLDRASLEEARDVVMEQMERCMERNISDWGKMKNVIRDSVGDLLWKRTKRRPMILPIIMEV